MTRNVNKNNFPTQNYKTSQVNTVVCFLGGKKGIYTYSWDKICISRGVPWLRGL